MKKDIDLLRKLGSLKIKEKELNFKIHNASHTSCLSHELSKNKGWETTALEDFFEYGKGHSDYGSDFSAFCEFERGGNVCGKCNEILDAIIERKKVRKQLATCKGLISKLAMKMVKEGEPV